MGDKLPISTTTVRNHRGVFAALEAYVWEHGVKLRCLPPDDVLPPDGPRARGVLDVPERFHHEREWNVFCDSGPRSWLPLASDKSLKAALTKVIDVIQARHQPFVQRLVPTEASLAQIEARVFTPTAVVFELLRCGATTISVQANRTFACAPKIDSTDVSTYFLWAVSVGEKRETMRSIIPSDDVVWKHLSFADGGPLYEEYIPAAIVQRVIDFLENADGLGPVLPPRDGKCHALEYVPGSAGHTKCGHVLPCPTHDVLAPLNKYDSNEDIQRIIDREVGEYTTIGEPQSYDVEIALDGVQLHHFHGLYDEVVELDFTHSAPIVTRAGTTITATGFEPITFIGGDSPTIKINHLALVFGRSFTIRGIESTISGRLVPFVRQRQALSREALHQPTFDTRPSPPTPPGVRIENLSALGLVQALRRCRGEITPAEAEALRKRWTEEYPEIQKFFLAVRTYDTLNQSPSVLRDRHLNMAQERLHSLLREREVMRRIHAAARSAEAFHVEMNNWRSDSFVKPAKPPTPVEGIFAKAQEKKNVRAERFSDAGSKARPPKGRR